MDNELTLIEFVGIPYAGKTQTMRALTGLLDSRGIKCIAFQEYRGKPEFYDRMKLTPAVNFLRSLEFMRSFVEVADNPRVRVVLVDRGLYDTHCWFQWFKTKNELPPHMEPIISTMLEALPFYAFRRRVVWMDRNPVEAVRTHLGGGQGRQGRIVNELNLKQLQAIYGQEADSFRHILSFHPIDSNTTTALQVAESLIRQLKLSS